MQLVDRMNIRKHNAVNLNNIGEIIEDVVSKPAHNIPMLTLWDEFDIPEHKVLSAIAAKSRVVLNRADEIGEDKDAVKVSEIVDIFREQRNVKTAEDISTICLRLVDAEVLEKSTSEETDSYKITIPLYQMWLKQNKTLTTVFGK
ncbi:MAG: hypothetical protein GY801_36430 [bacterium]|nr:hypothetical protein [bacterium]